ncbi:Coiled-coil domain-containing protein 74A [Eumeta japonica]|uniref:Coiled-coil domain-containing protein 74A n=1 Tax=Eumeta variegata TaxID=151549 RepID=A0A4C1V4Z8_EUMVA|nr:Coiled-coil domain-containing protein 74A [Eumeta japonica]
MHNTPSGRRRESAAPRPAPGPAPAGAPIDTHCTALARAPPTFRRSRQPGASPPASSTGIIVTGGSGAARRPRPHNSQTSKYRPPFQGRTSVVELDASCGRKSRRAGAGARGDGLFLIITPADAKVVHARPPAGAGRRARGGRGRVRARPRCAAGRRELIARDGFQSARAYGAVRQAAGDEGCCETGIFLENRCNHMYLCTAKFFVFVAVKKPTNETGTSSGFVISGEPAARVAHLEHSVRFLQEQHRLMLSGLHAEIETLRERNRDLQFQLIFNKESSPKATSPGSDDINENENETSFLIFAVPYVHSGSDHGPVVGVNSGTIIGYVPGPAIPNSDFDANLSSASVIDEGRLRREVGRLEQEAAAARGEARAAEARALQLQRLVDAQAEKIRELELGSREVREVAGGSAAVEEESSAELRARLADAERLVRRLRSDAERQRREVLAGGVTNLLFDDAAAQAAHVRAPPTRVYCTRPSFEASRTISERSRFI